MNERIRELYQQAHSVRHHDNDPMREGNPPTVYWQGEVSAQRFAELIVEECIQAVKRTNKTHAYTSYDVTLIDTTINKSIDSIKQHFETRK